jgi:hypothetical protein
MIACYNNGNVTGDNNSPSYSYTGGVVGAGVTAGMPFDGYAYMSGCYNSGTVKGNDDPAKTRGVMGFQVSFWAFDCYWEAGSVKKRDGTDLSGATGAWDGVNSNSYPLCSTAAIPAWGITGSIAGAHHAGGFLDWGTGNGLGRGKYWNTLSGPNAAGEALPKLFWE